MLLLACQDCQHTDRDKRDHAAAMARCFESWSEFSGRGVGRCQDGFGGQGATIREPTGRQNAHRRLPARAVHFLNATALARGRAVITAGSEGPGYVCTFKTASDWADWAD